MVDHKSNSNFKDSFQSLKTYCESQKFKGWDPYDGLNSSIFKATPLKNWDLARLAWIQGFKRSPINFRKLLGVSKSFNNMGLGLFLSGYCNLYKIADLTNDNFFSKEDLKIQIHQLAEQILKGQSRGYSGACWGYNFDWQARRLFLFPAGTPNVVVTSFCAEALIQAYDITSKQEYLDAALSAYEFVVQDLGRTEYKNGLLFSYSPLSGNNTVFNASLLGAKILLYKYKYQKDINALKLAQKAIDASIEGQGADGSWVYGLLPVQGWIDSFHTGFNLNALQLYLELTGDENVKKTIDIGFEFYINSFFLEDGTPKYYHNKIYPIDIHCPGQLLMTLHKLKKIKSDKKLADKVLEWTIINMQDKKGYFYYQRRRFWTNKISYMRWSNAFMFNGISSYLLAQYEE